MASNFYSSSYGKKREKDNKKNGGGFQLLMAYRTKFLIWEKQF
jgi:hypothetical protein